MRHRDRLLSVFLLSLALAAPAQQDKTPKAQEKPGRKPEAKNPYVERFEQLDRNRDGYVTLPEWPLEPASFHRVDRNRDGRLSRTELLTPNVLRRSPLEEQFRRLDTNRDGRLSRSEQQRGRINLGQRDRNKDGSITLPEYGQGAREDLWDPRATVRDQRRFDLLDRDRDNRVNRLEWNGSSVTFNELDRNRDGVLSPNEWRG